MYLRVWPREDGKQQILITDVAVFELGQAVVYQLQCGCLGLSVNDTCTPGTRDCGHKEQNM